MKYRIKETITFDSRYYQPQIKRVFLWQTLKKINIFNEQIIPIACSSKSKARGYLLKYSKKHSKQKTRVVHHNQTKIINVLIKHED